MVAGPIRLIRMLMPSLCQGSSGTIINMSSINGMDSYPWVGAYPAAKHALQGASASIRREARANGLPLKVVLVEPGPVNTLLTKQIPSKGMEWCDTNRSSVWMPAMRKHAEFSTAGMAMFGRIPFRLAYEAWEVAEVCAWIVTQKFPRARYVCCRGPFLWL